MKEKTNKTDLAGRPHVVFLIADDHRGEAIGAFGNEAVQTPVLDLLVSSGTACRNTHIFGALTGAVCAPSRACVHTGIPLFRATIGKDMTYREHSSVIRSDVGSTFTDDARCRVLHTCSRQMA